MSSSVLGTANPPTQDALRLLARPEPVVSGVYAKKSRREMATIFADGVKEVLFGPDAAAPYPLKFAATGFLRLRAGGVTAHNSG
jgi:hypothetical protein